MSARRPAQVTAGGLMSVADITVSGDVSGCQQYDRGMSRWEPNARGRLEQAALELYGERGFEQTTVAEIAGRAVRRITATDAAATAATATATTAAR